MPMKVRNTGIDPVDKLYGANITGNLVPPEWCHRIVGSNGKPNMNAVVILSEILYWYRPKVEQIGTSCDNVRLTKKFTADLLQISYGSFEKKFNLSRDQCKRAIELLESMGLIKRHYRTVAMEDGRRLNNVMYIELFADKVLGLTGDDVYDPGGINPHRVCEGSDEAYGNITADDMAKPVRNTKTTTEISNKDYLSIYQEQRAMVKEQISYDYLIIDRKTDRGMIDNIVELITEINLSSKGSYTINGAPVPAAIVRDRLSRLDIDMVKSVLDKIKSINMQVINAKAYLLSTLFNEPVIYETDLDMKVRYDMYGREASA